MEMRDGMLGVVIIAIAISIALFGSYLAGVTPHEEEYTNYEYLTDVNVLFDYDTTPRYIDYDPSANYTGYYTNDTFSESANRYYFAVDEVGFEPSGTVNNYKVPLPPTFSETTISDLSQLSDTNVPGTDYKLDVVGLFKSPYTGSLDDDSYSMYVKSAPLQDVLADLSLEYNIVRIASRNNINIDLSTGTTDDPLDTGWVIFFINDWVNKRSGNLIHGGLSITTEDLYEDWQWPSWMPDNNKIAVACLSCEINTLTGYVTLYSDNQFQNAVGTYVLSNAGMAFGSKYITGVTSSVELSNQAIITKENIQNTYLNPMYGVHLKEETA